jgi:L-amino acid N-acyltransferase YncA
VTIDEPDDERRREVGVEIEEFLDLPIIDPAQARATIRGAGEGSLRPLSDGVVTIRPPEERDAARLIAGRDEEWHRWLAPGSDDPRPTACIVVASEVIGWVDYDTEREWLQAGEVNVGYNVFASHRGKGYASRAVELLIRYLDESTNFRTATVLIDPDNGASLAVAVHARFVPSGQIGGRRYFKRIVRSAERR